MAEKKILNDLLDKYRRAANVADTNHKMWFEFYRYYRSAVVGEFNDYKEKRILPIAFSTIMSILPRIMALKPEIRYVMRKYPSFIDDIVDRIEQGIDLQLKKEDVISLMDYVIQWQWDKAHGEVYLQKLLLYSLIYGTSIMRVGWDEEKNSPEFEVIEPFYFYPNPEATDPFDMEWCIIRSFISKDKYKELFKKSGEEYNNSDEISATKDTANPFNASSRGDGMVEVFEYYSKKEIITFTKDRVLTRYENIIGRIPVVVNYNYIPDNGFWGMSEIDPIQEHIKDLSDFRTNRHINLELTTNAMWRIDPTKEVSLEDLVSAPGQMVRAEEGALERLIPPPIPQSIYTEDMLLKQDIKETSGISDYLRGGTPQRYETATAIENLVQSGNARINMRIINLVEFFMKPLGELLIEFNKKFLKPTTITVPYSGGLRQIKIDYDALKAIDTDYDILVIPNNIDKTRKEEFLQFVQLMFSNQIMAQYVNIQKLLETMFKMWNIPTYGLINDQPAMGPQPGAEMPAEGQAPPPNAQDMIMQQLQGGNVQNTGQMTPEQLQQIMGGMLNAGGNA